MRPQGGDWFEYDWQADGKTARFAVDLSYKYDGKTDDYPFLFFVNFSSPKKGRSALTLAERFRIRLFLNRMKLMLEPIYVGSIKTKKQIQHYLYAKDNTRLDALKALAKKQSFIRCRVDCTKEKSWETYFSLLYPDAAKRQTEKNLETIELLKKNGHPLSATRRICLHMFFPNEPAMLTFAEQARLAGFAVGDAEFSPEQNLPYGIVLIHLASLRKREIDDITTRAILLAEKFDGTLTYWDCSRQA